MDLRKLVRGWDDDVAALVRCPQCQSVVMRDVAPFTVLVHSHGNRQREQAQLLLCVTCRTPLIVTSGNVFDGRRWMTTAEVKAIVAGIGRESQELLALVQQIVEALKHPPAEPPGPADHFEIIVGKPRPQ